MQIAVVYIQIHIKMHKVIFSMSIILTREVPISYTGKVVSFPSPSTEIQENETIILKINLFPHQSKMFNFVKKMF